MVQHVAGPEIPVGAAGRGDIEMDFRNGDDGRVSAGDVSGDDTTGDMFETSPQEKTPVEADVQDKMNKTDTIEDAPVAEAAAAALGNAVSEAVKTAAAP